MIIRHNTIISNNHCKFFNVSYSVNAYAYLIFLWNGDLLYTLLSNKFFHLIIPQILHKCIYKLQKDCNNFFNPDKNKRSAPLYELFTLQYVQIYVIMNKIHNVEVHFSDALEKKEYDQLWRYSEA